jgi:hypothetical protein
MKEIALLIARKTGLPTLGKKRCKKSIFPTYPSQKIALDNRQAPTLAVILEQRCSPRPAKTPYTRRQNHEKDFICAP